MKKQHTGMRKRILNYEEKKFKSKYIKIVKLIYSYKEHINFRGYTKLNKNYKKRIKKYWKQYNIGISLKEFEFYKNRNAKDDERYIIKKIFHSKVEPYMNNIFYSKVLSDKNYLDLILKTANLPETIVRKSNGTLLDGNYKLIDVKEAIKIINEANIELIYKPSIESCGGQGIKFFKSDADNSFLEQLLKNDNFVIQRVINQHKKLKEFNSTSLNTVRVLSLLYKNNVNILYMVLRTGKPGMRLDNASAGGVQVVIENDGSFSKNITTIDNKIVLDSDVLEKYKNRKMPFYDEIILEIKRLHPYIPNCKIIGWDVAINETGQPIIVEINLLDIGMTEKSQCVNGPLFGKLTDEIMKEININRRKKDETN